MSNKRSLDFSTVLASSVHDMKNSIGMLMHLVDQVQSRVAEDDADFGQLQFEAARLNNYLIQLMTLYKLEQSQYRGQHMEYYLDEFVEDLVLMNRPILEPRGVRIEQRVSQDLCWVFDGQLVTGVISNILTNVIRYADGQVRVSADRVRVEAEEKSGYLCIRVEDDGTGFPEKMLGNLEQLQMGVDFISGSTGFGLYFSQQVAGMHRNGARVGFVRLSNGGALGGGCFELYLP